MTNPLKFSRRRFLDTMTVAGSGAFLSTSLLSEPFLPVPFRSGPFLSEHVMMGNQAGAAEPGAGGDAEKGVPPQGVRVVTRVGTSVAGFVGTIPGPAAPRNQVLAVSSWTEFCGKFSVSEKSGSSDLVQAVYGFFLNGGGLCYVVNVESGQSLAGADGPLERLGKIDQVAVIAAPGRSDPASHEALREHCERLRNRIAILDPPEDVDDVRRFERFAGDQGDGLRPRQSAGGFTAIYYPWIVTPDPWIRGASRRVPPSGYVAGVYARTDTERGVHKAPANAVLRGAVGLAQPVDDADHQLLNPLGVNCIRLFPSQGIVVWGARTTAPRDSGYLYVPVRRLLMMIEQSIERSTAWTVFEENDERLWQQVRQQVEPFLNGLWREGAMVGSKPDEAFVFRCDSGTNPPELVQQGKFSFLVGVAPTRPAEFVLLHFQRTLKP